MVLRSRAGPELGSTASANSIFALGAGKKSTEKTSTVLQEIISVNHKKLQYELK